MHRKIRLNICRRFREQNFILTDLFPLSRNDFTHWNKANSWCSQKHSTSSPDKFSVFIELFLNQLSTISMRCRQNINNILIYMSTT